MSSTIMYKELE